MGCASSPTPSCAVASDRWCACGDPSRRSTGLAPTWCSSRTRTGTTSITVRCACWGWTRASSCPGAWGRACAGAASCASRRSTSVTTSRWLGSTWKPCTLSTVASAHPWAAPSDPLATSSTARSTTTSRATRPSSPAWPTLASASTWHSCPCGAGARRPSPASTLTPSVRREPWPPSGLAMPCPSTGARSTRSASDGCGRRRASTHRTSSPSWCDAWHRRRSCASCRWAPRCACHRPGGVPRRAARPVATD